MKSEVSRLLDTHLHWNEEAASAWSAGLLEGDGCIFGRGRRTRILVSMTDEEPVLRFADIVGATVSGPHFLPPPRKPQWGASLCGLEKIEDFFVRIEPYLGERRRARFQEALVGVDAGERITSWEPSDWNWLPWAAGLFEAEGCVTWTNAASITVTSTDRDVLDRFSSVVGGPIYGPYDRPPPRKPISRWSVSGRRCAVIATGLRPWLGERRRNRMDEVIRNRIYHKRPGQGVFLQEQWWV